MSTAVDSCAFRLFFPSKWGTHPIEWQFSWEEDDVSNRGDLGVPNFGFAFFSGRSPERSMRRRLTKGPEAQQDVGTWPCWQRLS